ncbi:MAG: glycosyltransferase [Clostridia bacterium]|nr:glycosyltransferase [Clostridia bacterium]MDY5554768.1 glycosyltransferase [Blautia sp.]
MQEGLNNPLFSVIMPVYNVEVKWLKRAVQTVTEQTYSHWQLCIVDDCSTDKRVREFLETLSDNRIKTEYLDENRGISGATNRGAELADGDYLVLMDNDDELDLHALEMFARRIRETGADIIYSDQDIVDLNGNYRDPLYKTDWSPELILSQMYVGHLLGFKKELFQETGGFRSEYNGSQDYDLFLRLSEKTNSIEHIPEILYHWRAIPSSTAMNPDSKPYAQYTGLAAVQDHLDRTLGKGRASVQETESCFVYDVRYNLDREPKVSVIIPTKDHVDLLKTAVESIEDFTEYSNYEIIILDNNSVEPDTFAYFNKITEQYDNIKIYAAVFPFNWSRLNNYGISKAKGDVFIFLNNDIKIISRNWMRRLAEKVVQDNIGVAGGLLLYEDGTIQHAGVVAGMGGWAEHVFKGMKPVHYGSPFLSPMVTRNVTAVTGACMAVSRKTIEKIGGFNEDFIICGSDVELCIRAIQNGFRNVYDPNVKLYHMESRTRDSYIPDVDFRLSEKMYASYLKNGDPYYNKNLDYFSVQPSVLKDKQRTSFHDSMEFIKREYLDLNCAGGNVNTHIDEINPYVFRKSLRKRNRINILLPSINPEHVFGGISTALKFFEKMADELGYDRRIILVDAVPSEEAVKQYKQKYEFVSQDQDSDAEYQIVSYSERKGTLPVSENDYFMFTGWWTAHCAQEAYDDFEKKEGIAPNIFINFIQDFEPGFYPWSSRYLLADATYKNKYPQIAVFNTGLLQDYFHFNSYHFYKEFAFEPVLNDKLKVCLDKAGDGFKKKKQILIYGRPGTERNAFKLIVAALRKWVWYQNDIDQWTVLSAGEQHDDVYLGNGKILHSVGKLSIEEYGKVLSESFAGISLMASPHPSYPPLEMSVFGIKVITNTFANKDLKEFNSNIVSLQVASPNNIASSLNEICNHYVSYVPHIETNREYLENRNVFGFIPEIKEILEKQER